MMRQLTGLALVVAFVVLPGLDDSMSAAGQARRRATAATTPSPDRFEVYEQSILALQAALTDGRVTSRGLVESYLARIAAYDQAGPRLNAIVTLNPHALEDADAMDRERTQRRARGPLHGIPVLVKDNYDTADMPTSGGTLALATMQPTTAYQRGLDAVHLTGARICVLLGLMNTTPDDEEVAGVVQKALDAMKAQGADVVDVMVPGLEELLRDSSVIEDEFKFDLAQDGSPTRRCQAGAATMSRCRPWQS